MQLETAASVVIYYGKDGNLIGVIFWWQREETQKYNLFVQYNILFFASCCQKSSWEREQLTCRSGPCTHGDRPVRLSVLLALDKPVLSALFTRLFKLRWRFSRGLARGRDHAHMYFNQKIEERC